jgi:hypothetical protein
MRKSDQIIHAIKMILGVYIFICTSPFTYVFGVCVLCPIHVYGLPNPLRRFSVAENKIVVHSSRLN